MNIARASIPILCASYSALCNASQARAQCFATYEVEIILPVCQEVGAEGAAIAEDGNIAGSYSCSFGPAKAFGLIGDKLVTVPELPGYTEMLPRAINSTSEIAGDKIDPSPERAFLYSNAATIELPLLPNGNRSAVGGMQQAGAKVVGYSAGGGLSLTAVLWDQGASPIQLNLPIGPSSVAYDINDNGEIVGWMGVSPIWLFSSNAFIWHNGMTIDLGIPPGGIASVGVGINNSREVCGYHWVAAPGSLQEVVGWIWSEGNYTTINPLPGYRRCYPKDVSDHGFVVGSLEEPINPFDPNNPQPAFIWRNGAIASLSTLAVPQNPTLRIIAALGINNAGQIAASGKDISTGQGVALRLNPLPSATGDSDFDCDVDVDDLLKVINTWRSAPAKGSSLLPTADFNHDQIVNILDLMIVIDNWTGNKA
jgi:hypothetical protein